MKLLLIATFALALVAGTAHAAKPVKPKPWQWTPTKVVTRLQASSPLAPAEIGNTILAASCRGVGKAVAGRYSRFTCDTRWGSTNGSYRSTLTIRILAVGSGKLCVIAGADGRSLPAPGPRVQPERACP